MKKFGVVCYETFGVGDMERVIELKIVSAVKMKNSNYIVARYGTNKSTLKRIAKELAG